jgi:hypothetical protein
MYEYIKLTKIEIPTSQTTQSPLKNGLMLYREANRVDRENIMQLFINPVDNRRSFYVLKHVIHTISYDGALYYSNCTTDWPHSYLSAILPENLQFFSLQKFYSSFHSSERSFIQDYHQ